MSKLHIISTMRGKDQYEVEKDTNGKTTIAKIGLGAKQREGFEYEYTCTFLIDQKTHIASSQKDNTHLFETYVNEVLTEKHGELLIQWANSADPQINFNSNNVEVKKAEFIPQEEKTEEKYSDMTFEEARTIIKNFAVELQEKNRSEDYFKEVSLLFGDNFKVSSATEESLPKLIKLISNLEMII